LEFKRDLSSIKPIMRTLIAFANTAGGILVIGRGDNGVITGIDDVLQAEESIANAIADSIMPAMMPDIDGRMGKRLQKSRQCLQIRRIS
jgi:predicted HTH transcriptional regulator